MQRKLIIEGTKATKKQQPVSPLAHPLWGICNQSLQFLLTLYCWFAATICNHSCICNHSWTPITLQDSIGLIADNSKIDDHNVDIDYCNK